MTLETDALAGIRRFGDPILETRCEAVRLGELDDRGRGDLAANADAMLATIHAFRARHSWGRAIAATQVGLPIRLIALAIDGTENVLVNPEIVWRSRGMTELWDDCISLPEIAVRVSRHDGVTVRFADLDGAEQAFERAPLNLSELLQHEVDHLDGVLMTHRMRHGAPIVARENRALVTAFAPPKKDYP